MKRIRSGFVSLLVTASVLGALVALNVIASRGAQAWDLTRSGINTLSPQSVLSAKRLSADLQVIGLYRAGAGNGQTEAESLVGLYQAQSAHVVYRAENYDTDVADVRKYAVKEPGTLVLDLRGRTQLLSPALQTEQDFTSALIKLESNHVPVVCWAIGAGGRSLTETNQSSGYSGVADILARNNFAIKEVLLSEVPSIPSECDEVALVGSTVALPAPAVGALDAYLEAGGGLLIAADPWAAQPAVTQSLSDVLKPYGLAFSGALVVEPDASRAFDALTPAVFAYGTSPITRDIQGVVSFFPQTTAIVGTPDAAAAVVAIGTTTSRSYAITAPRQALQKQTGDAAGPFTIMEALERPSGDRKTRIVIVGTTAFAENRVLPPNSSDANLELALGSFQWLAGQDSLISLPPKSGRALSLALTQQDQSTIIFITVLLLPGLMALGGVMVWWRRRVAG